MQESGLETTHRRLLIADNDEEQLGRLTLKLAGQLRGASIRVQRNGRRVLEDLQTLQIDLLVTELRLPEADGLEVLIESLRSCPKRPVIVLSDFPFLPEIEEFAGHFGSVMTFQKPLEVDALVQRICDLMGAGEQAALPR